MSNSNYTEPGRGGAEKNPVCHSDQDLYKSRRASKSHHGSKVMAILVTEWILPIGGASSGRVCASSLRSRLVYQTSDIRQIDRHDDSMTESDQCTIKKTHYK